MAELIKSEALLDKKIKSCEQCFNDKLKGNDGKRHDIKIVMDLVLNHTSSEHYWFKEAINNPTTKYRNYYYFAKGKGRKNNKAPNNWQSVFVGSAWEPLANDKTTYCMHLFCKEQIDLNYHETN